MSVYTCTHTRTQTIYIYENIYSCHVSPTYTCQTNTVLHIKPGNEMWDNPCIWTTAASKDYAI